MKKDEVMVKEKIVMLMSKIGNPVFLKSLLNFRGENANVFDRKIPIWQNY